MSNLEYTSLRTRSFKKYGKKIDSPRVGGWYSITGQAITLLPQIDDRVKARLTTWLVDQRRLGNECPEILQETITEAKQQKDLSVHDRAERLLQYIGDQTVEIGKYFSFFSADMSNTAIAAWSESVNEPEVAILLEYLGEQGWIKRRHPTYPYEYTLTVEGYARLEELETANAESSKGFVAMWFDDSTDKAWKEGIRRGIEDAGYEAVRIDQKEHNNKIDDEIIAEIRRSRFVVADFTQGEDGARGGVYYEAGFAHGLGIEVIFTCREDALKHVHFDTRQYNHIVWKKPEELRQRLAARISAVIGDGRTRRIACVDVGDGEFEVLQKDIVVKVIDQKVH